MTATAQGMLPLDALTADEARSIDTFAFDLDDTVLDHGQLGLEAYTALHALREADIELVAITGRPSGFAEIVARQWPVTAAIAENGAIAWSRDADGRVRVIDEKPVEVRASERARLHEIARGILERYPEIAIADDDWARRTDVALDIGEHRSVPAEIVERARAEAEAEGARTFASSVHTHLTFELFDKASGFARLARALGRDPVEATAKAAFAGDSANDAAAFGAFGLTFGVENVRRYENRLPVPPRYVASLPMGRGFAEIAVRLIGLRVR
jgi:HAD superfamily hydrolase (TIGR01484 family)